MDTWDADATRRAIQKNFGPEQLVLARPCIRSLSDRQFYAAFHYQRAERTLARYVSTHLQSKDFIDISFGADEDEWNRFNIVIRKIGADLTACIQSLHALPDVLASAIYFSLQLNARFLPKPGRYVNHAFVADCLEKCPDLNEVYEPMKAAVAGSGFRHLAALANQSKHCSIVFPALSADLTGKRKKEYMLVFPVFQTARSLFPQVFVNDFLPPVHEHISRNIVLAGHALNSALASVT